MLNENQVLNNRYRLEKKVGQGGFAQVFLATDLTLRRTIALKLLNAELVEDENFLERFGAEARAVAALDHPNILPIYDFGQTEGTAYLVMPFVEGGTLGDKLRREKRFEPAQTGVYLQQMAAALDYAHRRNVVHRDIKPQNMLLRTEDNRLLLSDFGLAKVLSSTSAQSMTSAMGTLSYMAPEQLNGNVVIATDIYALGCVVFQLLTGSLPYGGPTEQVVMGHLSGPIPSITERTSGRIGPTFQAVIDRALSKRPEDRYASAGQLSQAFQAALAADPHNDPTRAIPYTPTPTVPVISPLAYEATQAVQTPPNPNQHLSPTRPYNPNAPTPPPNYPPPGYPAGNTPPQVYQAGPAPLPLYPIGSNTPPQPYVAPPPRSNKGLIALIVGLVVVLLAVVAVLVLVLTGSKSPTPNPVAESTQTRTTVVASVSTAAPATTAPAILTTAAPTTAAPATTTTAPTTVAPALTTAAPETTTAAPTTAAPETTVAPPPTTVYVAPPPPPPNNPPPDLNAIQNLLTGLPGNVSAQVILPDGPTVASNNLTPVPAASTIKLWIAATVLDQAKNGQLNLADKYQVRAGDVAPGTGVLKDRINAQFTYAELLNTMLVYSDNGIANVLITRVGGATTVNKYSQANGYNCVRLQRRLGYVNEGPENLTCARDAAVFMQQLIQHKVVDFNSSELILQALQNRLGYSQDQNYFGPKLPPNTNYRHISGVGTGVRNEVGFIATNPADPAKRPLVIALYTSGVPSEGAAEQALSNTVSQIYNLGKN